MWGNFKFPPVAAVSSSWGFGKKNRSDHFTIGWGCFISGDTCQPTRVKYCPVPGTSTNQYNLSMAYVFLVRVLLNTALSGKSINNKDFGVTFLGAEAKSIGCDMHVIWRGTLFFLQILPHFFCEETCWGQKRSRMFFWRDLHICRMSHTI